MKKIYASFLILLALSSSANNTFDKLCEVNKCWLEQKDVSENSFAENLKLSEKEWIRFHLMSVEQILRGRNTNTLSASQKQNREKCLTYLHQYWNAGNFPINEDYTYRTPIFIDKHDNFCAVGYLVKASGHENISRMISAKTNLAYVHDMKYPELFAWANESGFTLDELAWIQPQYPPDGKVFPLGGGFNTEVTDLAIDSLHHKLYAIGSFYLCDYNVYTDMIAVMDLDTKVWSNVGTGLYWAFPSMTMNCITVYHNKVFVGGGNIEVPAFGQDDYSVLYWDLDSLKWFVCAGIEGEVKNFYVWDDTLYSCGMFTSSINNPNSFTNVAKLSGNVWVNAGFNVNGHINVMNEYKGDLIVAGEFDTVSGTPFKNIFRYNRNNILPLSNGIQTEVYDIGATSNNLIAVGEAYFATDSTDGLHIFNDSIWGQPWFPGLYPAPNGETKITSIEIKGDTFCIAGYFGWGGYTPNCWVGCYSIHSGFNLNYGLPKFGMLDNGVKCMKYFDNRLYLGGDFTKEISNWAFSNLNSIAYCDFNNITAINEAEDISGVIIYPNPATQNSTIQITAETDFTTAAIFDISGREILQTVCNSNHTSINMAGLAKGIYLLQLNGKENAKAVRKIIIQ